LIRKADIPNGVMRNTIIAKERNAIDENGGCQDDSREDDDKRWEQRASTHRQTTPKAFANFSPGLERSDNPGFQIIKESKTLKAFAPDQTPFQG